MDFLFQLIFSPDGSTLVAGGQCPGAPSGIILLWSVADILQTGSSSLYSLQVPYYGSYITSLAFSFDGGLLAAGSGSGDVYIWDAASMTNDAPPANVFPLKENGLNLEDQGQAIPQDSIVASSSINAILAAAYAPYSDTGGLVLWDINSGDIMKSLPAREINTLDFSPDGTLLAVGSSSGQVALWSAESGRGVRDYPIEEKGWIGADDIAFSPDGNTLSALLINGKVYLLNTYRAEVIWAFDSGIYSGGAISFSPDGKRVIAGIERNIFIVDTEDMESIQLETALKNIVSLAVSPDGNILALGDRSGAIELWNTETLWIG